MSIRIPPNLANASQQGPREFWIQLENHPWDLAPSGRDRMTGRRIQDIPGEQPPELVTLKSPVTGIARQQMMYKPLKDALIYRRYTKNWTAPDDHKVNPWDLNEQDPTDAGTMGTIPGAVLHLATCVPTGSYSAIKVHFRNLDMRADSAGDLLPVAQRTHSIHPHGVVFGLDSDGAYPLSPPSGDAPNSITAGEAAAWAGIGVTGSRKLGDRVPPGGTFTYTWDTLCWPTTAGVWLYHDHSMFGDSGTSAGAIGVIVVHNVDSQFPDPEDFYWQDLPESSTNGYPIHSGRVKGNLPDSKGSGAGALAQPRYRKPPSKALYLQLYHELSGMGMCQMLTVSPGTTVNWMNDDDFEHTITSDEVGLFDINLPAHGSVSNTFSNAGVFSYHCQVHPNMTGSVMVM